jgi:hypothetical protein
MTLRQYPQWFTHRSSAFLRRRCSHRIADCTAELRSDASSFAIASRSICRSHDPGPHSPGPPAVCRYFNAPNARAIIDGNALDLDRRVLLELRGGFRRHKDRPCWMTGDRGSLLAGMLWSSEKSGVVGTRYAVSIQKLSSGSVRTVIWLRALTQYVANQPGTTRRTRNPFSIRQRRAIHFRKR